MKRWIVEIVEKYRQKFHLEQWYIDVQEAEESYIIVDPWYYDPQDRIAILRVNDRYPKEVVIDGIAMRMREMAMRYLIVETPRLLIRHIQAQDFEAEWKLQSQPDVALTDGYAPIFDKQIMEQKMKQLIQDAGSYVLVQKASKQIIGHFSMRFARRACIALEIGYAISPEYWNQGYASEAVQNVIDVCFTYLDVDMVVASHFPNNEASKRVIKKNHMHHDGCLRQAYLHDVWGAMDLETYSITKREWENIE